MTYLLCFLNYSCSGGQFSIIFDQSEKNGSETSLSGEDCLISDLTGSHYLRIGNTLELSSNVEPETEIRYAFDSLPEENSPKVTTGTNILIPLDMEEGAYQINLQSRCSESEWSETVAHEVTLLGEGFSTNSRASLAATEATAGSTNKYNLTVRLRDLDDNPIVGVIPRLSSPNLGVSINSDSCYPTGSTGVAICENAVTSELAGSKTVALSYPVSVQDFGEISFSAPTPPPLSEDLLSNGSPTNIYYNDENDTLSLSPFSSTQKVLPPNKQDDGLIDMTANRILMSFEANAESLLNGAVLLDSSGNNLNGSVTGVGASIDENLIGHAYHNDGTSDLIVPASADLAITDSITFMAWFKLTGDPQAQSSRVLSKSNTASSEDWGIGVSSSRDLEVYLRADSFHSITIPNILVADEVEYFVTVTYSSGDSLLNVYINGINRHSQAVTGNIVTSGGNFAIASHADAASDRRLVGDVDEVAVFADALPASVILDIYNRHRTDFALAGAIESPVHDSKQQSGKTWTSLSYVPSAPYGKQLFQNGLIDFAYSENGLNATFYQHIVGIWHFDTAESQDTPINTAADFILDSSGRFNHATLVDGGDGSATWHLEGQLKESAQLDGVDDYFLIDESTSDLDSNVASKELTLSAWVRTSACSVNSSRIIERRLNSNRFLHLICSPSRGGVVTFDFLYDAGSNPIHGITKIDDNEWHFITAVRVGNVIRLYVDGKLEAERNDVADVVATGMGDIKIGGTTAGANRNFGGYVDEVAIWNRALTHDEVRQIYTRGATDVKIQLRTCDLPDCSDGLYFGYEGVGDIFSERSPRSSPLPQFEFNHEGRYIQYKIDFVSRHGLTAPVINHFTLE